MATKGTIIGIGEAILTEIAGRSEPGGLALEIALAAHRLGDIGVAISRLGQDVTANELLTQLIAAGLDTSHLQSDPDLPTGRLVVRTIAGRTRRSFQQRAAFDNLQWDFDLVDAAQRADAVVFGMFAQRGGQSQSVITRFISECGPALRVLDLTNRDDESLDRRRCFASLEQAHVLIIDQPIWSQLHFTGSLDVHDDVLAAIIRPLDIDLVLHVHDGRPVALHTADAVHQSSWTYARAQHAACVTGLVHGLLSQYEAQRCLQLAGAAADHARSAPSQKLPEGWDE